MGGQGGGSRITEPGVYEIPADEYHFDPVEGGSLSSSGARRLLPPSCPARFRWEVDNPRPSTRAMELGTAAHARVLSIGPEIVVVDAGDWRTKAAQQERDGARARGAVPLLAHENEQIEAMARALREHPLASALLDPDTGTAEPSLFWVDQPTGVWCRARLDWLPTPTVGDRRLIVPDYKTTRSADPEKFAKSAFDYGYFQQAAWYVDGALALGLAEDVAFVFIAQDKDPPYLVTVAEADGLALRHGRDRNREALELYAECRRTDTWPGYTDDVADLSLPVWLENQYLRELTA